MDSSGSEYATGAVSFKHGNERSGFIKCGNHLDKVRRFEILKEDSAALSWTVYRVMFWLKNEPTQVTVYTHTKAQGKNVANGRKIRCNAPVAKMPFLRESRP